MGRLSVLKPILSDLVTGIKAGVTSVVNIANIVPLHLGRRSTLDALVKESMQMHKAGASNQEIAANIQEKTNSLHEQRHLGKKLTRYDVFDHPDLVYKDGTSTKVVGLVFYGTNEGLVGILKDKRNFVPRREFYDSLLLTTTAASGAVYGAVPIFMRNYIAVRAQAAAAISAGVSLFYRGAKKVFKAFRDDKELDEQVSGAIKIISQKAGALYFFDPIYTLAGGTSETLRLLGSAKSKLSTYFNTAANIIDVSILTFLTHSATDKTIDNVDGRFALREKVGENDEYLTQSQEEYLMNSHAPALAVDMVAYANQYLGGFNDNHLESLIALSKTDDGFRVLKQLNLMIPSFNAQNLGEALEIANTDNPVQKLRLLNRDTAVANWDYSPDALAARLTSASYNTLKALKDHGISPLAFNEENLQMYESHQDIVTSQKFWDTVEQLQNSGFSLHYPDLKYLLTSMDQIDSIESKPYQDMVAKLKETGKTLAPECIPTLVDVVGNVRAVAILDDLLQTHGPHARSILSAHDDLLQGILTLANADDPQYLLDKYKKLLPREEKIQIISSIGSVPSLQRLGAIEALRDQYFSDVELTRFDLLYLNDFLEDTDIAQFQALATYRLVEVLRDNGEDSGSILTKLDRIVESAQLMPKDLYTEEELRAGYEIAKQISDSDFVDPKKIVLVAGIHDAQEKVEYLKSKGVSNTDISSRQLAALSDENYQKIQYLFDVIGISTTPTKNGIFRPTTLNTQFIPDIDLDTLASQNFQEILAHARVNIPTFSDSEIVDLAFVHNTPGLYDKILFLSDHSPDFKFRYVGSEQFKQYSEMDFSELIESDVNLKSFDDCQIVQRLIDATSPQKAKVLYEEFNIKYAGRYSPYILGELADNADPAYRSDAPKVVFIVNQSDYNGGFDDIMTSMMEFHKAGFKVLLYEADNDKAAIESVKQAKDKHGALTVGYFAGHGSPETIRYGPEKKDESFLDTKDDYEGLDQVFERNGPYTPLIITEACSAAQGDKSITAKLGKEAKVDAVGSNDICNRCTIDISDNRISVDFFSNDEKLTRFLPYQLN